VDTKWQERPMEPPCITIEDTQDVISSESVESAHVLSVTPQKFLRPHPEMIASAVRECVEQKISVKVLAKKYDVHRSTIHSWVKKANKQIPRKERKSNKSISSSNINPPPPEAHDNAMDKSNFDKVFVRNSAQKETDSKQQKGRLDTSESSLFHRVALEMQKKEAEMKKMENEWKKREEEWKAKMTKKDEELENKAKELSKEKREKEELAKELTKEKEEKEEVKKKLEKEKKDHDEAKKELDDIKQMNFNIGDLLSRKRARPPVQEYKGEYVEELKTESKPNENLGNDEIPRYSRSFFQMEAGLIKTQTDVIGRRNVRVT